MHGLRGVGTCFKTNHSQVIDTTRRKRSEKEGRRLKSEERQGEEAIESTQQRWSEDGYCLKQSSHVQNNSTNGTRKRQKITNAKEQENEYFLEEKKKRKETDKVLTEKPPVLLEQQQKNWADQGLGKKGGNQRRAEEKEKEREKTKKR